MGRHESQAFSENGEAPGPIWEGKYGKAWLSFNAMLESSAPVFCMRSFSAGSLTEVGKSPAMFLFESPKPSLVVICFPKLMGKQMALVVVWEMKLVSDTGCGRCGLQHVFKVTAALKGCSQRPAVPLGVFVTSWDNVFISSVWLC